MKIETIGSKILRTRSKNISKIDDTLRCFCRSMAKTMYENNGVGLAAPQVGVNKRIIVVDNQGEEWFLINPEIIWKSDDLIDFEEGCLSIPDKFENVKRSESIKVKYRNIKGKPIIEILNGLLSRIVQHEIDHLDGILFVDHLP